MKMGRRRLLRRLRRWLQGNPQLVIPAVVVSASPKARSRVPKPADPPPDEHFIWGLGADEIKSIRSRRSLLPSRSGYSMDDSWTARYRAIYQPRNGGLSSKVTYDPKAAEQTLLRIIEEGQIAVLNRRER